ncbi:MAG TPA: hypothetical protein VFQ60_01920 [Patescibacteria group bacterium]|nr:hypothetical protein [Patescibacteria group bacterium]
MSFVPYLVAAIVLILIVSVLVSKIQKLFQRPEMIGLEPEQAKEKWEEVKRMSDQGVMGAKIAVIEADKLLDNALKAMFMPGETLGERLKVAAYKYPKIRNVWPAHKLRNQLVHDASFEITPRQAKEALRGFEDALKTLHVL